MVVWSNLLRCASVKLLKNSATVGQIVYKNAQTRPMSSHNFFIEPSRWQWYKTKDLLHLYTLIGIIPAAVVISLTNMFIGPATLEPIPEGYEPEHWEYCRHPIERFFAKIAVHTQQERYESVMCELYEAAQYQKYKKLVKQVKEISSVHSDVPGLGNRPYYQAKYYYRLRENMIRDREIV